MIKSEKYLSFTLFALCGIGWLACTQERQPCLTPKIATLIIESVHLASDTATIPVDTALPAAVFAPIIPKKDTLRGTPYPQQSLFSISLSPDSVICQWEMTTDSLKYNFD